VALDAVLADPERAQVDHIVCLGDVAWGPQPRQTVGGDAVTTLLYHSDSYLREMDATVTRVEGERVALGRTVF
jgi:hypothetical protein